MDKKIAYKPVDQFENGCLYSSGWLFDLQCIKTTQCIYADPRNALIQSWHIAAKIFDFVVSLFTCKISSTC